MVWVKRLTCFFLLVLLIPSLLSQKIIGGTPAVRNRYTYLAGLAMGKRVIPYCGGVLISPKFVLTAAHCQNPKYVYIGCFNSDDNDCDRVKPKSLIRHPNFNDRTLRFDFMIIKLSTLSKKSPISYLNNLSGFSSGLDVRAIGFGYTETGKMSSKLMEVDLKTMNLDECQKKYKYEETVYNENLCAWEYGKDTCTGDSGGPLIFACDDGDVLVGLTSWGKGCANRYPGVYARVGKVITWINEILSLPSTKTDTMLAISSTDSCIRKQDTSIITSNPTVYETNYPTNYPTPYPTPFPNDNFVGENDDWWCFFGILC